MQMKKYKEIRRMFLEKYDIESERLFFDDYNPDIILLAILRVIKKMFWIIVKNKLMQSEVYRY